MLPEWVLTLLTKWFGASFRTTALGLAALGTCLYRVAGLLLDGDPATNPDWNSVAIELTVAWGLLFTRDNKVSSEQAGAVITPLPNAVKTRVLGG